MTWVLVAGAVWAVLACAVALIVARALHLADQRSPHGLIDVDRLTPSTESPWPLTSSATRLPGPRRPARIRRRTGTPVS